MRLYLESIQWRKKHYWEPTCRYVVSSISLGPPVIMAAWNDFDCTVEPPKVPPCHFLSTKSEVAQVVDCISRADSSVPSHDESLVHSLDGVEGASVRQVSQQTSMGKVVIASEVDHFIIEGTLCPNSVSK